jgi:hypothetical protein
MATSILSMQRRHFQLIADVLWDLRHEPAVEQATLLMVIREFQRQLKRTNPKFDGERFYSACVERRS